MLKNRGINMKNAKGKKATVVAAQTVRNYRFKTIG